MPDNSLALIVPSWVLSRRRTASVARSKLTRRKFAIAIGVQPLKCMHGEGTSRPSVSARNCCFRHEFSRRRSGRQLLTVRRQIQRA